jgi:RNA polymerase sigma-70 factor (TIGR02943 family)
MEKTQKHARPAGIHPIDPHQWVARFADYLYMYALIRVNDEDLARDLVQETFLAALERLDQFEGRSTESTWLTAILRNKIIDIYRKRSSGLAKVTEALHAEQEQQDFFDPADGHWNEPYRPREIGAEDKDPLLNKELAHILQMCLQKLPALWLAVFTMKHMEEQPTDIICHDLKVTPSNFWVIIHRTKLNLRACLQRNWI